MNPAAPIGSAIVVGAGPGGCSCAVWLAQQGVAATLVDRAPRPLSLLERLDLQQDWVLGFPGTSTAELAQRFAAHVRATARVDLRCGAAIERVEQLSRARKALRLADGTTVAGSALVVATGLRPRAHPWGGGGRQPLDAITLTTARSALRGRRVLLLGGGDNAVENALYLAQRGNEVVLWSRSPLRAQRFLAGRLSAAGVAARVGVPMPQAIEARERGWRVAGGPFGEEQFDEVAVLFGFEPDASAWDMLRADGAWRAAGWPDVPIAAADRLAPEGVFLAGDVSQRQHPCIQTALADGVATSRQVLRWLSAPNP